MTATALLVAGCGGKKQDHSAGSSAPPGLEKLTQATTYTTVKGLPKDPDPAATTDGTVVHPLKPRPISATVGGAPLAVLPSRELGGPTWVPVMESKPGWVRVLLPSRPNGATGWIPTDAGSMQTAHSPYVLRVKTSTRKLSLSKSGHALGTWTVAVGAPKTPTPVGRTFLLASMAPAKPTFSPLILPVGAHSDTLDSYGGGPGTVAFHGWPSKSVFGQAVTHGCVRVPADALKRLSKIPLGTPVFITN
ncbi:L,D-transpeptidase [Actinoallomurus sp. NBC_01490]|uniref:L,D-transpeptidase n=1 Tax=Actinoallomurus sp. NBC_01490 TaxID=2903557 RepID=UPI002E317C64|nr:L,D-transpeptidase [Actinoallomurus sp. NBC_01490]